MGLESATFISGLNANNPVNASDSVGQGDDHLRLIKTTLLNTFPNISGAMNASHTELNNLVGVTGKTGTGNVVLGTGPSIANPTITGGITLPSNSIADAALSANVPLLNASNTFTGGTQTLSSAAPDFRLNETDAAVDEKQWAFISSGGNLTLRTMTDAGATGELGLTIIRTGTNIDSFGIAADSITANGSKVLTTAGNGLTKSSATVTLGTPSTLTKSTANGVTASSHTHSLDSAVWDTAERSTAATLVAGQVHARASATSVEAGFSAGEWTAVYNDGASGITLSQGAGLTLRLAGTASTGSRTLAQRGLAVIWYNSGSEAVISGSGVT